LALPCSLTHLAKSKLKVSELRKTCIRLILSPKIKLSLTPQINVDQVLEKVKGQKYASEKINTQLMV
jgi:hypothetical protein